MRQEVISGDGLPFEALDLGLVSRLIPLGWVFRVVVVDYFGDALFLLWCSSSCRSCLSNSSGNTVT